MVAWIDEKSEVDKAQNSLMERVNMYKFRNMQSIGNIEDFMLSYIGIDLLIPSQGPDELTFFHNGDKLTVNTKTGKLLWEPLKPGEMATSKLSMRIHQWFGKGIIIQDT